MLIRYAEGQGRKTRQQIWFGLAVVATLLACFVFIHRSAVGFWPIVGFRPALAFFAGPIALVAAVAEFKARRVQARAGKPVIDFGDRSFLYWRTMEGPPEEISYAEVLACYSTLLASGDGEPEAFATIEFRKRRRIKLRSSYLDIGSQQLLSLIKLKMDTALQ